MHEPDIICERRGFAGWITLNRPTALNAVNHSMVRSLAAALDAWEDDPAIRRVVICGAGEKAFCAGGDLRSLYDQGQAGEHTAQMQFWFDEYRLNHRISTCPKPYIALIDGIVMGGGVGVALHGSHRIAGERFVFAMPEVSIGFFPDVGASYFLPRLPGCIGAWAGLTGGRITAGDACALGLATGFVSRSNWAGLCAGLESASDLDGLLATCQSVPPDGILPAERGMIDASFAPGGLVEILARLDQAAAAGSAMATRAAAAMRRNSPLSMAIALEQLARGRGLDLAQCLAMEYRIVARVCRATDIYEGIRAVIIDKDNRPLWKPALLEDVDAATVARYFAPLPSGDLIFGCSAAGPAA